MAQIFGSYFLQTEFKRLYQTLLPNLNKCRGCGIIKCFYYKKFEILCTSCRTHLVKIVQSFLIQLNSFMSIPLKTNGITFAIFYMIYSEYIV